MFFYGIERQYVLHAFRKAALLENAATFVNVRRDRARIR